MSVLVHVIGRLGADAEVKTSKNGNSFVTFRMATDEFKNGERTTAWLKVLDSTERGLRLAPHLKKGSHINVSGVETVSIYMDRNNVPQISRDISSFSIDFVASGNSGGTATQSDKEASAMSCGTLTPKDTVASVAPSMASAPSIEDVEDDLPF